MTCDKNKFTLVAADSFDNCPLDQNADQRDTDRDGIGDICDNCIYARNINQADFDGDGTGNVCEDDYDSDRVCKWTLHAVGL